MVNGVAPLPYIFMDVALLSQSSQAAKFRSTFIALHEHLDTFLDKRESALVVSTIKLYDNLNFELFDLTLNYVELILLILFQCLDGIKSTLKLQTLGESIPELNTEEQQIDLCRCLYKLHFQLSLIYDTYISLLAALLHAAHASKV